MKTPQKKPLTPVQVLLILLIAPATYGLLALSQPDKGHLLILLVAAPLLVLAARTGWIFLRMLF
jgi:hypothetical protein